MRPRALEVANDPRGRTGLIPCAVMRLVRSAPAHAATKYTRASPDFRHASPACDRTYTRSRAARRARPTAVQTYQQAECDHSLVRRPQGNYRSHWQAGGRSGSPSLWLQT